MERLGLVGKKPDGTQVLRCVEGHLWERAAVRGPGPFRCPDHVAPPTARNIAGDPRVGSAVRLAAEGWSLRSIGEAVGVTGECVRLWLNSVGVDSDARRALKERHREERDHVERERAMDAARVRNARCAVCGGLLVGRRRRTCSHDCAVAWTVLRTHTEEGRRRHRDSIARSILKHPEGKSESSIRWAERQLDGGAESRGTWYVKGSRAHRVAQQFWGGGER